MKDIGAFLKAFQERENFAYSKINHGFWEALGDVYCELGEPVNSADHVEADRIAKRKDFFEGGFVDELLELLRINIVPPLDPSLFLAFELTAWPDDNAIIGTPFFPERSVPVLEKVTGAYEKSVDGLLLKRAVMDGSINTLFDALKDFHVVLVGPEYIQPLLTLAKFDNSDFVAIHPTDARRDRLETETKLRGMLNDLTMNNKQVCVLLQAGTLAPYWILKLRADFPTVRWIDGGLALSIGCPDDLLKRPWGKTYRKEIISTYKRLGGAREFREPLTLDAPEQIYASSTRAPAQSGKVAFVEDKNLDYQRLERFLTLAKSHNQWANRGPAWSALGKAYHEFFECPQELDVIACANGGIALEALAQLHAMKAGKPFTWVVSAFGFANTGRGVFASARVIDCDEQGMMCLRSLSELDQESYDGIVVTNPFGLCQSLDAYAEFARKNNKAFIVDNAAGVKQKQFHHSYQAFSLHHTKPFGHGEGGLVIVPRTEAEEVLSLMEYTPLDTAHAPYWVGNGKISEMACSALLQRLETYPQWAHKYEMQSVRINAIAERAGLSELMPRQKNVIATSLPYLAAHEIVRERLQNSHFALGHYYKPIQPLKNASDIFSRIVNIPSHPDMRYVDTDTILAVLRAINSGSAE